MFLSKMRILKSKQARCCCPKIWRNRLKHLFRLQLRLSRSKNSCSNDELLRWSKFEKNVEIFYYFKLFSSAIVKASINFINLNELIFAFLLEKWTLTKNWEGEELICHTWRYKVSIIIITNWNEHEKYKIFLVNIFLKQRGFCMLLILNSTYCFIR